MSKKSTINNNTTISEHGEREYCMLLKDAALNAHISCCPYRSFFGLQPSTCIKRNIICDSNCDYVLDFRYELNRLIKTKL